MSVVRWFVAIACFLPVRVPASAQGAESEVSFFRLRAPGDVYDIQQGSGLHHGRLGSREGLWIVCDRNGRESAGKLYFVAAKTLRQAKPRGTIVADDEFTVVAPAGGWAAFASANQAAGEEALADLRKRITLGPDRADEPYLDLEAITIAPGVAPPAGEHAFVVAEEPFSTVLELAIEGQGQDGKARLLAVYAYAEKPGEQGSVRNDGLEAIAYAGQPGRFYFAEEATRKLNDEPRSLQLFSLEPRLGRAELKSGRVQPAVEVSDRLTESVRGCRKGRMQTLNALTALRDGRVLAVDRNGGWIDEIDPAKATARPWLNLYDLGGVNLRELLADFPAHRNMPYISIEGISVDETGAIWLVDDPAMPEGWRQSCLVRIVRPGLLGTRPSSSPRPTQVSAHRGASGAGPENTLAAFRGAIELGCDYIELDVRTTRDGQLVILHDATLDRTTTGRGALADHTLEALRRLSAGERFGQAYAAERIPTFDEVCELARGRIGLYVDVKDASPQAVADALRRHDLMQASVVYGSPSFLAELARVAPESHRMPPLRDVRDLDALIARIRPDHVDVDWDILSPELVTRCHSLNIRVFSDALGDHETANEYRRAVGTGIDCIQTDHPQRVFAAFEASSGVGPVTPD